MTAVLGERGGDGLAGVALDLEAVGAPAGVAGRDGDRAVVRPAGVRASRRLWQKQAIASHHAVGALGVHGWRSRRALLVHQRAGTPVAIARQLGDLMADLGQELAVSARGAPGSPVDPRARSALEGMNVRPRQPERLAHGPHSPSPGQQGRARYPLFSVAYSTASLRISFLRVFLPKMRCSLEISARAAASSEAGTTASPACTAVNAPCRSSLRHWKSRRAGSPRRRSPSSRLRRRAVCFAGG